MVEIIDVELFNITGGCSVGSQCMSPVDCTQAGMSNKVINVTAGTPCKIPSGENSAILLSCQGKKPIYIYQGNSESCGIGEMAAVTQTGYCYISDTSACFTLRYA